MVYQISISTMYLHFSTFFFDFHYNGVGGGGRCHCRRFSPVDTAVILVPRQYIDWIRISLALPFHLWPDRGFIHTIPKALPTFSLAGIYREVEIEQWSSCPLCADYWDLPSACLPTISGHPSWSSYFVYTPEISGSPLGSVMSDKETTNKRLTKYVQWYEGNLQSWVIARDFQHVRLLFPNWKKQR